MTGILKCSAAVAAAEASSGLGRSSVGAQAAVEVIGSGTWERVRRVEG